MRFESREKASVSARRFRDCPKVHFWANKGEDAYIVLKVPEGGKFWSDYIRDNPEETFGGYSASLTYLTELIKPEKITVDDAKIPGGTSPCGSHCQTCPTLAQCGGCPALMLT